MSAPLAFTVLMAVYDGDDPGFFEEAVASAYANDCQPDDFVLVVDGPVRAVLQARIVACAETHGLRVIWLPKNQGLAKALNAGLSEVRTEWVARADADDINLPDRFAKQISFIEARNGAVDLLGGAIEEIDEDDRVVATRMMPTDEVEIQRFARRRNPFNHMTVVYRTELVRQAGGYPALHLREDYGLWARLLIMGCRVGNLPDIVVRARAGGAMLRRRGGWKYATTEYQLQRYLFKLGFKSLWEAGFHLLMRSAVFVAPNFIRKIVYTKFLRS
ncbi:MAG: glycosyltransferase [Alphaproteobacteria bacterium]|nr:glycosyltransferase [Alphaproteobacteria bacterium]